MFVEDLIYLYLRPDLKREVEEVPCTIDVTIGADTMQVNGKSLSVGRSCVYKITRGDHAAHTYFGGKSAGRSAKKVLWDGQSKTALIICGMTTYRLTAGEKRSQEKW
ncbi:MAG: hypothetical protein V8Q36_10260 [Anaerotignum sp.]